MNKELGKVLIDETHKNFPLSSHGVTTKKFIKSKPNLFTSGIQFPMMVLKESSLKNNISVMAEYCRSVGAELAPHVKTTMSPQIAQMQVDAGAWALTIANFWQAEIFRKFGFKKLIIANEVLDKNSIAEIAKLNAKGKAEIIFYVDSTAGLNIVKEATPKNGKINLFIEIGTDHGRGGVRDITLVKEIAQEIKKDSRLNLRGVTGFEGAVPNAARNSEGESAVHAFCKKIVEAGEVAFEFKSDEKFIVSAGGSAFFEIVAEELNKFSKPKILLLRSGGYVTHDHIYYEEIYPFKNTGKPLLPAIEVWSQVLSSPESGFGVLNLGKRDVGCDIHNPIPFAKYTGKVEKFTGTIEKLNDQHGFMRSSDKFAVSELIGLGVSHPCTTFDKWKLIPLVNDDYDVVDLIHTFF
jgi:D-serine deaminase-like pyridoxal phosphate-dependent protein